jgi:hypothetical protein
MSRRPITTTLDAVSLSERFTRSPVTMICSCGAAGVDTGCATVVPATASHAKPAATRPPLRAIYINNRLVGNRVMKAG